MFNVKNITFSIITSVMLTSVANAQAIIGKISYSADKITVTNNKDSSMLNGNIEITVGSNIKLSGEKMLVSFTKNKKVAEFVFYGKGKMVNNGKVTEFENGIFDPNTSRLSAEKIFTNNEPVASI